MGSLIDARPSPGATTSIAFLDFSLDLRGGQLKRGSHPIPLRPKTWAVLLYLASRPGVLVARDELLDAVWPATAITPDTLTKSIGELRTALADDSKSPRCIETVHRRGFRFIAPIATGATAERAMASEIESRPEAEGVFVGRVDELAHLERALARASSGERQMVFVTGAAGLGKTALVEAFTAAQRADPAVLVGRGYSVEQHGAREPYMPILCALEGLARRPDAERFVDLLRRTAPTWLAHMPWLAATAPAQPPLAVRLERMLREFAALTEALATDITLVVVLEDLHWSDPSTIDLLAFLGRRAEPARLLIIGTYRPAEVAVQDHPLASVARTLRLGRYSTALPLHELAPEDLGRYLAARFEGADFDRQLAGPLHDYTDGNPLFVVAVLEHMLARGWIVETNPGWSLTISPRIADMVIPDDVRAMIEAQYSTLMPADQDLLSGASAIGQEFSVPILAAALGVESEEIDRRCHALSRGNRFLRPCSAPQSYAFLHELYRQGAYLAMPPGRRERLHQAIGEAIEQAHGERTGEVAAELAVHFERARNRERAMTYLEVAAARARQRYASREALGYLESALMLLDVRQSDDASRRRELGLRLALGPLLSEVHGFSSERVLENAVRTQALCAEGGTPQQMFEILYALCHLHTSRADAPAAAATLAQMEELATRLGTPEHRIALDSALVRTAACIGDFAGACRHAETWLSPLDGPPSATVPFGPEPVLAAKNHQVHALWMMGEVEAARALMRDNLAAVEAPGISPFTLVNTLFFAAWRAVLSGELVEAREQAERAFTVAEEHGFAYWLAMALALRAWTAFQEGKREEGAALLDRALADHLATGARMFRAQLLAFRALMRLDEGDCEAGLASVEEALAFAESTGEHSYTPELWRIKGELLLARSAAGRPARRRQRRRSHADPVGEHAERCFARALDLARDSGARSLELRAAISLSKSLQARAHFDEARAVLAGPCASFSAAAASADLAEARGRLARLAPGALPSDSAHP